MEKNEKYQESLPPKKKAQILEDNAPKFQRIMLQHTKIIINNI
jgi:hypothetical protein